MIVNTRCNPIADLMTVIRTSEPSSLEELSRRLGLNKNSVAYMLAQKCRRGTLAKREDGTYSLTEQSRAPRRGRPSQAQLGELLQTVAYCERIWRLQDRLDASDAASRWGRRPAR